MKLENSLLSAEFATLGAELTSLKAYGFEYIWHADPTFWKRHAPILFPIVGKVWNNTYYVGNNEYHLPQHGFARDSQFELTAQSPNTLSMSLGHTHETLSHYPYPFKLTVLHQLVGDKMMSQWTVENVAENDMYFQIGAHPAFNLPHFDADNAIHGHLAFYHNGSPLTSLSITRLSEKGHALPEHFELPLPNNLLDITPTLFVHDALVVEGSQVDRVVILDADHNEFLQMDFDAPVLGIWSPVNAPFVCIEPWYGRTDAEGFNGNIDQREHIQHLTPHQTFTFNYTIKPIHHD